MPDAHIIPLNRTPEYAPILAHWAYCEWYRERLMAFDLVLRAYRDRAGNAGIPLSLVAVADTMPVGMVTLKLDDLQSRRDLNPWLSSLYVMPEYRRRGLGASLAETVMADARERGFTEIFLFLGQREQRYLERYYAKRGWAVVDEARDNDGRETRVMRRGLGGAERRG
jgi:GNAT superfamily N-acetyltransferase